MIRRNRGDEQTPEVKYPGVPTAMDGSTAVVEMEIAASEAAGAYPITPSTQMGEGWAAAKAAGQTNVNGRRLLFFEPEGEHAAAGVTAGMSMTGLRATNFSSGQGIAYMHESLYAAVGKRLTYVLNVAARAMTKHALNVHAGHDDYHAVDDTGFFQVFAKDVQCIADLTLIAHRIAELSLNPGLVAQDGFLTSHVIESMRLPERDLIKEYLGDPADIIESPTPAQMLTFGKTRRRIPEMFDLDYPALLGSVQNQDAYMQGVAAQRPFYFDHVQELADRALAEYAELSGRRYARVMGYRLEDAEYVLAGQGSVVSNAEAVADYLREERGLRVGVMDVVMFRPFPADLISAMLHGKKGVTVLERCDQPLAVDQPLLREIRATMSQGQENYRATRASKNGSRPFPGVSNVAPEQVPDFYSAGFGFGSRDLQPADLVLAVENMLPGGRRRRQYYLGIDFVREGTRLPKLEIWQEELLEHYPDLAERALVPESDLNLLPADSISLRIHSVGGWGAITMGKNVVLTAFELAGLNVKANPKYGSEKKGQPTTFYGVLSRQPLRLNGELKFVNVVLSPDPNVFRNSNPLAGLQPGGVFVIQSDHEPDALWASLPPQARQIIQDRDIKVFAVDAFKIATEEATDPDLRYRMQGTAFMGAFFRTSPFMGAEGLDEETLFAGIRKQVEKKFGHLGERVVEANVKVIRRGFDEVVPVEVHEELAGAGQVMAEAAVGQIPTLLDNPDQDWGIGNQGRFWEQVCSLCGLDQDVIADPFSAISAIPAATSTVRDMSDIRFEIPDFIASKCTGCSQCWTQCPDAAIPGLVNSVEEVIQAAIRTAQNGKPLDRIQSISANLAREARKTLKAVSFTTFGDTLATAYQTLADKLPWDAERKKALDEEFAAVYSVLSDFPLARTVPFFDKHESKEKGAGGLLSITVNPEACKGCNICVDVCADGALVTVHQDEENLDLLRRNWKLWENLPDTADRFINIRNLEEGIGVLPSLLLKKENYRTMAGGDGACMGCGEKTAVHLIVSAVESLMQPRVENFVGELEKLIDTLDGQARALLSADADLDLAAAADGGATEVPLDDEKQAQLKLYTDAIAALKDLLWRYTKGPSGQGRANMGISNSTGCSSVWGSTFPYNPYPYPWVNHLFQDSPSVAIGIFEGHMRKMANAFIAVRRSRLLAAGEYDAAVHEPEFTALTWEEFTDEEFDLCAPIVAIGGDGAMLDIGFQNLSRLLASGKPIRVIVLDTQVYSNTGGQACTSGFIGQVSDMAAYGKAQHGKEETRKELALIALAHRGAFVLQSSQASASHMIGGVIRALKSPRPAVLNIYTPCPVEHGLADEWAPNAARFALEGRAFPFMIFDPDAGSTIADCLDLGGNPDLDQTWPTYELEYMDDAGEMQKMELPVTTADWAATEGRFKKHFKRIKPANWDDDQMPFHEFLDMSADDRIGKTPFVWVIDAQKKLGRLACSMEMVLLAEDRLLFWSQLKELAGLEVPASVRADIATDMESEFEEKAAAIRAEYEAELAELRMSYPALVARRMAEGLLASGDGNLTVAEILARANADTGLQPVTAEAVAGLSGGLGVDLSGGNGGGTMTIAPAEAVTRPAAVAEVADAPVLAEPAAAEDEDEDDLVLEPYIETARCTSCDECININKKLFAYDENKQAYIKDARAGTFAELVQAAEKCTAEIIHPGTPLNKKEKDLDKWIERAKPFS